MFVIGTSAIRAPCELASAGMKRWRSPYSAMRFTTCARYALNVVPKSCSWTADRGENGREAAVQLVDRAFFVEQRNDNREVGRRRLTAINVSGHACTTPGENDANRAAPGRRPRERPLRESKGASGWPFPRLA